MPESEFELWQGGMPVAMASGPRETALAEIRHYAEIYGQDAPTIVYEVRRHVVDPDPDAR